MIVRLSYFTSLDNTYIRMLKSLLGPAGYYKEIG